MNTKMNKLALVIGALVLAGGAMAADTATMGASATVAAECAVGNGVAIALGNLEMLNLTTATQTTADSVATSTFSAICTNGTTAPTFTYVSANKTTNDFRLKGTGITANDYITYTPYSTTDGSGTAIVGGVATTYGGATPFTGDGTTKTLNLSAKILAADKAKKLVQAYTDTITITAGWTP